MKKGNRKLVLALPCDSSQAGGSPMPHAGPGHRGLCAGAKPGSLEALACRGFIVIETLQGPGQERMRHKRNQERRYLLVWSHISPQLQQPMSAIVTARRSLPPQERFKTRAGPTGPQRVTLGRRSIRRSARGGAPRSRSVWRDLLANGSGAIGGRFAIGNHLEAITASFSSPRLQSIGLH